MLGRDRVHEGWVFSLALGFLLSGFAASPALAQKQPESKNMELVGYNDLQNRSAYQPTIHKQGNRWIAYIGLHGGSGMNPLTGKVELKLHGGRRHGRSEAAEIGVAHSRR